MNWIAFEKRRQAFWFCSSLHCSIYKNVSDSKSCRPSPWQYTDSTELFHCIDNSFRSVCSTFAFVCHLDIYRKMRHLSWCDRKDDEVRAFVTALLGQRMAASSKRLQAKEKSLSHWEVGYMKKILEVYVLIASYPEAKMNFLFSTCSVKISGFAVRLDTSILSERVLY